MYFHNENYRINTHLVKLFINVYEYTSYSKPFTLPSISYSHDLVMFLSPFCHHVSDHVCSYPCTEAIGPHQSCKSSVSFEGWFWGMTFFFHRLNRCKMAAGEQVVLVLAAVTSSVALSLFIRQNNRRRSGCLSALSHRQPQRPRIQPNHQPCSVQVFEDIKVNCGGGDFWFVVELIFCLQTAAVTGSQTFC